MTFDENVQAIANNTLLPKVVDAVYNSNVLTARVLKQAETWMGPKLERSIRTNSAGNGGSFSGVDKFNTNAPDTKQKLSFDPRGYEQPVVIPQMEADAVASSKMASVQMVAAALEEAKDELIDGVGSLLYGDGTGNSSKDFLGLAAIVDDGGEVDSYGGLSRSTVGNAIKATENDLGGALTLAAMRTAFDGAKRGSMKPTLIVTTETIWSAFEALHTPTVTNNQMGYKQVTGGTLMGQYLDNNQAALKGELGFDALTFRGVPVVADEKASSGVMWFLNEKFLKFYRLKSTDPNYTNVTVGNNKATEGIYEGSLDGAGIDWSGFIRPTDQYANIGHMILMGNLVSFNPRMHAAINTIS